MGLETERLILGTWDRKHWQDLRPLATDPEVTRYITGGAPWTNEQIRGFVDRQLQLYAERRFCRWRLIEKSSRNFIGFCGIGCWFDHAESEIGWWLAPSRWGRGLATEAARTALRDAFERIQLERIVSVAMRGNAASIRIMQKLGFKPETEFERDGFQLVRYAISRVDYEAAKD